MKIVYFVNDAHVNLMEFFVMKCMMYVSVDLDLDDKALDPNLAGVGWCYSTTQVTHLLTQLHQGKDELSYIVMGY